MKLMTRLLGACAILLVLPVPIFAMYAELTASGMIAGTYDWTQAAGLAMYLRYVSLALIIAGVVALGVFLFSKRRTTYIVQQDFGSLRVTKAAIEQFVAHELRREPLVKDPQVTARMKRKSLAVQVRGALAPGAKAGEPAAVLTGIRDRLAQALGVSPDTTIAITLASSREPQRRPLQ